MADPAQQPKLVIRRPSSLIGHRGRSIAHTAAWSLVAKMASAANLFIAVPFVLRDLGPMEFGAWATLVSLMYFSGFLDFGFGNGTMNLVAAAHARGASDEVAIILREGRRTLVRVAAWLALAVLGALLLVPWYRLLGLPAAMAGLSRQASGAVLFSIVAAVPLNLANRVQLGLGRGERAYRWQAAGQLFALVTVVTVALIGSSLPVLTLAATAPPLLASACNTISLRRDPNLQVPAGLPKQIDIAAHIHREGLLFFAMQLAAAFAYSADLPLISALRDPVQAGVYAIVQRLFSTIPLSLGLVWAPLWPAYRHALATGHHAWVARTFRRSMVMAICIAGSLGSVIVICFGWITALWVHRALAVATPMLVGFAIWGVLEAAGTSLATLLNAASIMRFQVIVASAFATACFACKAWTITNLGVEWLPWVTAITWSITNAFPILWFRKRIKSDIFSRKY